MAQPHGTFYWNELLTTDVEKCEAFYKTVVGWDTDVMPMPDGTQYKFLKAPGVDRPAGGMMSITPEMGSIPPHWAAYVAVDDVDAAVAKVEDAGGKVLKPPFDVEGVGRIAIVADPTGGALGLITPTE